MCMDFGPYPPEVGFGAPDDALPVQPKPPPWLAGEKLMERTYEAFRFIHFSDDSYRWATACWAALTHVYNVFEISPRLLVLAVESGSGKGRLLKILTPIVRSGY